MSANAIAALVAMVLFFDLNPERTTAAAISAMRSDKGGQSCASDEVWDEQVAIAWRPGQRETNTYWNDFRNSLPKLLKERGLKQNELAQKLRVTPNTVSNWVNGAKTPSTEMLFDMADYFGVSLDRLVGRVPPGTEALPHLRELVEALNAALKLVPDEAATRGKKGRPH